MGTLEYPSPPERGERRYSGEMLVSGLKARLLGAWPEHGPIFCVWRSLPRWSLCNDTLGIVADGVRGVKPARVWSVHESHSLAGNLPQQTGASAYYAQHRCVLCAYIVKKLVHSACVILRASRARGGFRLCACIVKKLVNSRAHINGASRTASQVVQPSSRKDTHTSWQPYSDVRSDSDASSPR